MSGASRSLWPRVLLLGDSLTEQSFSKEGGWGALLADSLQRRCDVVVRGFSGYNSRQWLSLCTQLPPQCLSGELALLWLGANDASTLQQGIPLAEYKTNLTAIVKHIKTVCGVTEVVLLTPPPSDTSAMEPSWKECRSGELTAQYAVACKQVAGKLKVPCVDLHDGCRNQPDWQSLLRDGLHLSARGSRAVHQLVLPVVQRQVAQFLPQGMGDDGLILPRWRDVANVKHTNPDIETWLNTHKLN